jgi:hypothetical protein
LEDKSWSSPAINSSILLIRDSDLMYSAGKAALHV